MGRSTSQNLALAGVGAFVRMADYGENVAVTDECPQPPARGRPPGRAHGGRRAISEDNLVERASSGVVATIALRGRQSGPGSGTSQAWTRARGFQHNGNPREPPVESGVTNLELILSPSFCA